MGAKLCGADLFMAKLNKADLTEVDLSDADLSGACFAGADLSGAKLDNANLFHADFTNAKLLKANITGIVFEQTITFIWQISGIKCDFIYLDLNRQKRQPKSDNFPPGGFEQLYASYPSIEYVFEQGAQWLDLMSFNYAYAKIKEQNPEFDLKSINIDDKGAAPRVLIETAQPEREKDILEAIVGGYKEALDRAKDEIQFLRELVGSKTPSISIGQIQGQTNLLMPHSSMTQYNIEMIERAEFLLNDIISSVETAASKELPKKHKSAVLDQLKEVGKNIREGSFREAGKLLMDESLKQVGKAIPKVAQLIPQLIQILSTSGSGPLA